MKDFMEPESVALIGISRKTGPGSFNIMENMIGFGFRGRIYPVNPNMSEILGRKAYPNIREVKEPVDLAVISPLLPPSNGSPRLSRSLPGPRYTDQKCRAWLCKELAQKCRHPYALKIPGSTAPDGSTWRVP